ncbi:hypothetical protein ES332_D10G179300v1 [Gossypium tomentosum]|uniref:RRM domain-containing protein n=1 Tax=Gossypium tomentosum TaxID=34277 RepID=A0A5D2J733_GOSTO|nr:hypothetical protein ES332_D10G179300v1 [Gossypium tomentosum]
MRFFFFLFQKGKKRKATPSKNIGSAGGCYGHDAVADDDQQQKQQQGCNLDEVKTIWVGDLVHWMDETYLHGCFSHTGEILSMKFRRSIYYTAMLLTKEMVIGSMMHMNSRMAVMDGPLEPSSSTAPSVADVPDGPAFVNFFSVCIFLFNFCPLITCNTFQYI